MREHKNISIADQIFDQLELDILSGKYARGTVISEIGLSKELGVSRTPVREAIRRLEQEDFLEESGRGLVVSGITRMTCWICMRSASPSRGMPRGARR